MIFEDIPVFVREADDTRSLQVGTTDVDSIQEVAEFIGENWYGERWVYSWQFIREGVEVVLLEGAS